MQIINLIMMMKTDNFDSQGISAMPGDIFGCLNWVGGWYWHLVGRGQDAANHPTMHGTDPTQNGPVPHGGNAKVEKPHF